ncbi:MAG: hypothetical protein JJU29_19005 [Verrucomicrobia bacterium]|nr:hypothetical protein [Verrucomicrobiota bacterium]MCH8514383.1 hypothetical protein [Kiritimatiellia bacterium]
MYWFEKNCVRVFAPGEARCWIKGELTPYWRGHWMRGMPNPCHSPALRYEQMREKHGHPKSSMRAVTRMQWATHEWLKTFPEDYSHELSMVSGDFFWGTLSLLTRIPEGREIFLQNPAWAILAVYGWKTPWVPKQPSNVWETCRVVFRHRKREVLGKFGLPEAERCVKLLGKVRTRRLTWLQLVGFVNLWKAQSPYLAILQHMEHIDPPLIHLLAVLENGRARQSPRRLSTEFLMRLRTSYSQTKALDLLTDVTLMEDQLVADPGLEALPRKIAHEIERRKVFRSLIDLEDWHDFLVHWISKNVTKQKLATRLPNSPIPGNRVDMKSGWVEVRGFHVAQEIWDHSLQQQNCMGMMIDEVLHGKYVLYEVMSDFAPLHSLQIVHVQGGWRIGQLCGPENRKANREVYAAVEDWLGLKEQRLQRERKVKLVKDVFGGKVIREASQESFPFDIQPDF